MDYSNLTNAAMQKASRKKTGLFNSPTSSRAIYLATQFHRSQLGGIFIEVVLITFELFHQRFQFHIICKLLPYQYFYW